MDLHAQPEQILPASWATIFNHFGTNHQGVRKAVIGRALLVLPAIALGRVFGLVRDSDSKNDSLSTVHIIGIHPGARQTLPPNLGKKTSQFFGVNTSIIGSRI